MIKKIVGIFIAFLVTCTGCGDAKLETNNYNETYRYALIETSSEKSDMTKIIYFDENLRKVGENKYNYGNVGRCSYDIPIINNGKVYELSEGYGFDKEECNIVEWDLKKGTNKKYETEQIAVTDILVDDTYLYAINNLNYNTYVSRIEKSGKKNDVVTFENEVTLKICFYNNKLYRMCTDYNTQEFF